MKVKTFMLTARSIEANRLGSSCSYLMNSGGEFTHTFLYSNIFSTTKRTRPIIRQLIIRAKLYF